MRTPILFVFAVAAILMGLLIVIEGGHTGWHIVRKGIILMGIGIIAFTFCDLEEDKRSDR